MRQRLVSLPEIVTIGVTRGMIGLGAGLLLSDRIKRRPRQRLAAALLGVGLLSTIPLAMRLRRNGRRGDMAEPLRH